VRKVTLACPQCGRKVPVYEDEVGQSGTCPACGSAIEVPADAFLELQEAVPPQPRHPEPAQPEAAPPPPSPKPPSPADEETTVALFIDEPDAEVHFLRQFTPAAERPPSEGRWLPLLWLLVPLALAVGALLGYWVGSMSGRGGGPIERTGHLPAPLD
jgi:DNA-directed RNA polymerase subunit RPC12/RpoP